MGILSGVIGVTPQSLRRVTECRGGQWLPPPVSGATAHPALADWGGLILVGLGRGPVHLRPVDRLGTLSGQFTWVRIQGQQEG
jgi:hypothetical protein